MKKILAIVLTMVFVAGMSAPSFAAKASGKKENAQKEMAPKFDRIVAEVVSLDVATRIMVVKEEKTGASRTIRISAKAASELKVGDRVRIKLKAGTDDSAGVRVLKPKPQLEATTEPAAEPTAEPVKK